MATSADQATIQTPAYATVKPLGALTATPQNDIYSGVGKTIKQIDCDLSLNTAEDVYIKLYDAATCTPGTTAPDLVWRFKKGLTPAQGNSVQFQGVGLVFATGVCAAAVQQPGKGGTTSPTGTVNLKIFTED